MLLWFVAALLKQARQSLLPGDPFYNAISSGAIISLVGVAVHSVFDFGLHITINGFILVALLAILSLETFKNSKAKLSGAR